MTGKKSVKRIKIPVWLIFTLSAVALSVVLNLLARLCGGFGELYAQYVYPVFVCTIGFVSGLFPFSVGEWLLYILIGAVIFGTVYNTVRFVRGKGRRKKILIRVLSWVLCGASAIYLIFTLFCGINYTRTAFSEKSGLIVEKYTAQDLADLCVYLVINANECAEQINCGENGLVSLDKIDVRGECVNAMQSLGEEYPELSGFYPQAKAVAFSEGMSYCKILGIYIPFTIEANYNTNAPYFSIPFTVCHELSHLKGFMREDEAGFIAYLACRDSDIPELRYSAYTEALIYALNAFYPVAGDELYAELLSYIHPRVRAEISANSKYWSRYETPVSEVSSAINDGYLKVQGQSDGKKSYGRFVDLMIYDYKQQSAKD